MYNERQIMEKHFNFFDVYCEDSENNWFQPVTSFGSSNMDMCEYKTKFYIRSKGVIKEINRKVYNARIRAIHRCMFKIRKSNNQRWD